MLVSETRFIRGKQHSSSDATMRKQAPLLGCSFVSQNRWVLITGEEPRSLASQAPATKCLPQTIVPTALSHHLMSSCHLLTVWCQACKLSRHRILEAEKGIHSTVFSEMNHYAMYWYRQDPGFGLQLIYYSTGPDTFKKGDVPEGYHVSSRAELERFPPDPEVRQPQPDICVLLRQRWIHSMARLLPLCTKRGADWGPQDSWPQIRSFLKACT